MELKEFFEKERSRYLKGFQTVHSMTKEKGGCEYEISVEQIDKEEMPPNAIENPLSFFRYDIILKSRETGNYYETKVNTEPTVMTKPLVFQENWQKNPESHNSSLYKNVDLTIYLPISVSNL